MTLILLLLLFLLLLLSPDRGPLVRIEEGSRWKKHLKKKIPIVEWLPQYNLDWAISDAIAGVTVGLTVIPQVISEKKRRKNAEDCKKHVT